MNNTLSKFLMFATGAVIGSVVTWKLVNDKYERLAQEEIRLIRDFYQSKDSDEKFEEEDDEEDQEQKEYKDIIEGSNYVHYKKEEKEGDNDMDKPYVISPDEYDDPDVGYETVTLYLYKDGVLAYMLSNEVVEDIDELVGEDSLNHFGEYEDDSVFVRNDRLGLDIEILKAEENYSEDE